MKFGKRLRRDAHQPWLEAYINYKLLKGKIKACVEQAESNLPPFDLVDVRSPYYEGGVEFFSNLQSELQKVNSFFMGKERDLESILSSLVNAVDGYNEDGTLGKYVVLCEDIDRLRKYVVLNYLAVRKILKKYDKKTKQPAVTPMMLFLQDQPFYNSLTLANIITKAQCLGAQIKQARGEVAQFPKEDFLCPVCLDVLNNPVVLSCAHRFCWACLAGASMFTSHNSSCPVCRKQQSLDPRDYTVDSLLMSFIRDKVSTTITDVAPSFNYETETSNAVVPTSGKESTNNGGFFYFFQQEHKTPTSITLLLVQSQFADPPSAFKFVKHVNKAHPNTDLCVLSTPSGAADRTKLDDIEKFPRITTMLAHTIENQKTPYVSFAEDTPLGTLFVLSFRSPKSVGKHHMPLLEEQLKQVRSAVFFVVPHCTFDQMDEVVFPILLRNKHASLKHLFLMSSPKEHAGTWRGVPFSALNSVPSISAPNTIFYTEVDIQEDLVVVRPMSSAVILDAAAPMSKFNSSGTASVVATTATTTTITTDANSFEDANFKFVCMAYVVFFVCLLMYAAVHKIL